MIGQGLVPVPTWRAPRSIPKVPSVSSSPPLARTPAVALRERDRDGRGEEAADAEGDGGETRAQRRVVLSGLEPQRHGQEQALQAGGEGELDHQPGREGGDPEQRRAQQRRDLRPLPVFLD